MKIITETVCRLRNNSLATFSHSHAGQHRSDVPVLPRLVRQPLQEHDRQHAAG